MIKLGLSALLFVGIVAIPHTNASAQAKAGSAKATESKSERLLAADASTYISEAGYELQWSPVQDEDILWRKRVHRSLGAYESANNGLANLPAEGFAAFLLEQIQKGTVKAYGDNYFRKVLAPDEVTALMTIGTPASFQMKEDWIYHRDGRGLAGRIIGIAPMRSANVDGVATQQPLFWVYYPELRPLLRAQILETADASVKNLDQWFEGRHFNSGDVTTVSVVAPQTR